MIGRLLTALDLRPLGATAAEGITSSHAASWMHQSGIPCAGLMSTFAGAGDGVVAGADLQNHA